MICGECGKEFDLDEVRAAFESRYPGYSYTYALSDDLCLSCAIEEMEDVVDTDSFDDGVRNNYTSFERNGILTEHWTDGDGHSHIQNTYTN